MKNFFAIIIISSLLASCTTKPPACSDKETLELMRQLFESSLTEAFLDFGVKDPSEFVTIIRNGTSLTLQDIRTKGYDENAKRYSCEATVELTFNQPNPRIPKVVESIHQTIAEIENYNPSSNSFVEAYQGAILKNSLNFLAIKTVAEFGSASLDTTKISGSVTYDSTFSESANKDKRHYLEAKGMRTIASYAKAVFSAHGFTDSSKEINNQQAQATPVEDLKTVSPNDGQQTTPAEVARADEATFQGTYIFGKNKITVEGGARGEDVFISSKCKQNVFTPEYDGEAGTYTAQDESYALIPHPEYTFIEVESSNKCFPEGRYWKKN